MLLKMNIFISYDIIMISLLAMFAEEWKTFQYNLCLYLV